MTAPEPSRGDIWDLNFDPFVGHEQASSRPALVVSVNAFNQGPADLVVALPMTRTPRKVRGHVPVMPPEGGLVAETFVQCQNVRSVSKSRLRRLRGRVSQHTLLQVEDRLRILLGL